MRQEIHNYYEVKVIDKNGEIVQSAVGYNTAYSATYLSLGYIDTLQLVGANRAHLIEVSNNYPGDPITDETTFWYRSEQPYREGMTFISGYRAEVYFLPTGSSGNVTGIRLYGNGITISEAALKDIEGDPIVLTYNGEATVVVSAFIYFYAKVSDKDNERYFPDNYPIKLFQPCNSILCGCCGKDISLLELVERYDHSGNHKIKDGYLPFPRNRDIGFTKSPIPMMDEDKFLLGGINDYVTLLNSEKKGDYYKNALVPTDLKGLVRAIVLPGVGIIDLSDPVARYGGPWHEGILLGSKVVGQTICYVPEEYIASDPPSCPISFKRSPFYYAPKVVVRRHKETGSTVVVDEEIPMNEAFFSDIVEDGRARRCMSFSQHVPLTDYYCGAETTIPCSSGKFVNENITFYGYDIVYSGETVNRQGISSFTDYIAASYLVVGEYIYVDSDRYRYKSVYPCKLEYSYDGITFETAIETDNNTQPYERLYFSQGTIAAPIWRMTSRASGHTIYYANNTTHGDKNVAEISGLRLSGYDPYFLFVGYDSSRGLYNAPGMDVNLANAAVTKATNITGNFLYGASMSCGEFKTTVPYLYHENDCIYFNGSLRWGRE